MLNFTFAWSKERQKCLKKLEKAVKKKIKCSPQTLHLLEVYIFSISVVFYFSISIICHFSGQTEGNCHSDLFPMSCHISRLNSA